jgi:hypothetical protein
MAPPTCYTSLASRHATLRGAWRTLQASEQTQPAATYYNLSCPLEMAKYSCVHQRQEAHAQRARDLTFEPADCVLPHGVEGRGAFLPGRRIVFMGDSLAKQAYIAFGCLLSSGVQSIDDVAWEACEGAPQQFNGSWPCGGDSNCITCGAHSGFHTARVELIGGSSLHFVEQLNQLNPPSPQPTDAYIIETGVHGNLPIAMATARLRLVRELLSFNSSVTWMITPQEFFPGDRNGYYHHLWRGSSRYSACASKVEPARSTGEWKALRGDPSVLNRLAGVVELDGLNHLGSAKVGGAPGRHFDCQHFCMPGVPDLLARAVLAMLLGTLVSPGLGERE